MNMLQLPHHTGLKIKALNDKANELCGYNSNEIIQNLENIEKHGEVIVGYRASCGTTDKTQKVFRLWLKAVKELEKSGIKLKTENLTVGNSYATNKGGFWNEIKYFLN